MTDALDLAALDEMTTAVQTGAGLPAVVRAAARALDASVGVLDRGGQALAVAVRSPADEQALLRDAAGVQVLALRVGDAEVGQLRLRPRGTPAPGLVRLVSTLIAAELERVRAPEHASEQAVAGFVAALLGGGLPGRD